MANHLKTWLNSWRPRRPARRHANPPTRFRASPVLKILEDRLAPATFTVDTLADSVPGSLREAILAANAHVNSASDPTDVITFSVAGTITVASPLPALSDASGGTVIDGRTAPGYAGAPVVVLRGPGSTSNATGLLITSAGNALWALQV